MAILGATVLAIGLSLLVASALPIRMCVTRRAVLTGVGIFAYGVGLGMLGEAAKLSQAASGSLASASAASLGISVVVALAVRWRLRRAKRDWEDRLRYRVRSPFLHHLAKRYYDLN